VVGLRWCDIDFDERMLTVSHQVQEHDGQAVLVPPKSDRSLRSIALDHVTVTMLRRLQERGVSASGFLCVNRNGRPWSPSYVTHTFGKLVTQVDLPPVRFHDLRHGAASLSLAAGNDLKIVQALLGHASIVLTADTYSGAWPTRPPKPPPHSSATPAETAGIAFVATPAPSAARPPALTEPRNAHERTQSPGPTVATRRAHRSTTPTSKIRSISEPCWWASRQNGAPPGTRTPNPLVKSQLLCQLS
jgi:hypothetical protein